MPSRATIKLKCHVLSNGRMAANPSKRVGSGIDKFRRLGFAEPGLNKNNIKLRWRRVITFPPPPWQIRDMFGRRASWANAIALRSCTNKTVCQVKMATLAGVRSLARELLLLSLACQTRAFSKQLVKTDDGDDKGPAGPVSGEKAVLPESRRANWHPEPYGGAMI